MSAAFRAAAGRFATGVTVVTTVLDGQPHGMTVNAFASVSIDPLLVLVSLRSQSRACAWIRASGAFAVTVLSAGQVEVARRFADPARPVGPALFTGVPWQAAPHTGAPVLVDGLSWFDCRVESAHAAGDHTVLIGRAHAFDVLSERAPLLFVGSHFTDLPHSRAGVS